MVEVRRGKQQRPQKVLIYGVEGIGKSSLAAQWPDPMFLDTEDRLAHLDVQSYACRAWCDITTALNRIRDGKETCKTVVLDTLDWAERLAAQEVCADGKMASIEDFGYGKGYVRLIETLGQMKDLLQELLDTQGKQIVIVAHAKVAKFEDPALGATYDRYTMKCRDSGNTNVSALFKEWCDSVLFANYATVLEKDKSDNVHAKGGTQRMLFTQHAAGWDGKNSWGLPASVPMDYAYLQPHIEVAKAAPPVADDAAVRKSLLSEAMEKAEGNKDRLTEWTKEAGVKFKTSTIEQLRTFVASLPLPY
jgi:hypothetical protein